jgi:hypothetical protein
MSHEAKRPLVVQHRLPVVFRAVFRKNGGFT